MDLTALKVRGPFRGPSGYDHHVREFVRELHNQDVAVELVDMPNWGPARLPDHTRDPWFESLSTPTGSGITLHFCMPHQVVLDRNHINVNYTMFEATRICREWVERSREHDLIILPTESSRSAWIESGVPKEKLRLCPLGINHALFDGSAAPMELPRSNGEPIGDRRVRFLNLSEVGPRKNHAGLLRAWLRATQPHDDAVLILKLGFYAAGWRERFAYEIEALQQQVGKRFDDAAPIHVVDALYSDDDMPRLFAAATHYISMSFGEGWDQAMVEAAATGLRLIAPNHSAYTAYLDSSVARLISSREVPALVFGGGGIDVLFAGAGWWVPDEDEAVESIRSAIDGQDEVAESARDRILRDFTWEKATRRLIEILEEARPRTGRGSFSFVPRRYRRA